MPAIKIIFWAIFRCIKVFVYFYPYKSHCEVLGMNLIPFEQELIRNLVHLSRLENFLVLPEGGSCRTAAVKDGELVRHQVDCSHSSDFICSANQNPAISMGGFGGRSKRL